MTCYGPIVKQHFLVLVVKALFSFFLRIHSFSDLKIEDILPK